MEIINSYEEAIAKDITNSVNDEIFFSLPLNNILSIISKTNLSEQEDPISLIKTIITKTIENHSKEKETLFLLSSLKTNAIELTLEQCVDILSLFTQCNIFIQLHKRFQDFKQTVDIDTDYIIDQLKKQIEDKDRDIKARDSTIQSKSNEITNKQNEIQQLKKQIESKDRDIRTKDSTIQSKNNEIERFKKAIQMLNRKPWLPEVHQANPNDVRNGYAGVPGRPIDGIAVSGGHKYRVHILGGNWLQETTGYDNTYNSIFSGRPGEKIDGFMIDGNIQYQCHTDEGWYSPVRGYNPNDAINGYAGKFGHPIDGISIQGVHYKAHTL